MFSSIIYVYRTVKYADCDCNLGRSAAESWGILRCLKSGRCDGCVGVSVLHVGERTSQDRV